MSQFQRQRIFKKKDLHEDLVSLQHSETAEDETIENPEPSQSNIKVVINQPEHRN